MGDAALDGPWALGHVVQDLPVALGGQGAGLALAAKGHIGHLTGYSPGHYLALLQGVGQGFQRFQKTLVAPGAGVEGKHVYIIKQVIVAKGILYRHEPGTYAVDVYKRQGLTLIQVELQTGRAHQIRVQQAHAGFPLWGDARYGGGKPGQQIALWAHRLVLDHPVAHQALALEVPPPGGGIWDLFKDVWEEIHES